MMERPLHAAMLALAGLLGGCASLGGASIPSALPEPSGLPAQWHHAPPAEPRSAPALPVMAGWAQIDEPLLPELIAAAEQASPSLAAAAARIERARALRVAAGAALQPRLNAVAGGQSGRSLPGTPVVSSASLGAQAGWELDLFGGLSASAGAAQARVDAADAQWQAARTAVAAETVTSIVGLRACRALVQQTQADAASREETSRLTELRAQAGFSAPAEAALARASAAQARSQLAAQQAQCEGLVQSLVELTALPVSDLLQRLAPGGARVPSVAQVGVGTVPADLLALRPDVHAAGRELIAAAGDRAAAEAALLPQISLAGSINLGSARSLGVTTSGSTWSLGPLQVSLPIFDGGRNRANVAASRAEYDAAVANYQGQIRRAVREVEQALLSLQNTATRTVDALVAAEGFEASLIATEARYRGGLASLFELEDSRRSAVAAQSALIELQRDRAIAWADLVRALGGGWRAPDVQAVATPPRPSVARP
jgi:outer membrane protein, multidrug efflux system